MQLSYKIDTASKKGNKFLKIRQNNQFAEEINSSLQVIQEKYG